MKKPHKDLYLNYEVNRIKNYALQHYKLHLRLYCTYIQDSKHTHNIYAVWYKAIVS